jgi:2-polyprenyl-6-methoxyphenol hydroxylase-like FAD-dependent oxidoreductase
VAVQARTLEIYSRLGIAERALDLGKRGTGANMWSGGRKRARIPLGDIGRSLSPFPFVLILGQDDNERILGDHLRTLDVSVQWSTELTALRQERGQVAATLRRPDGTQRSVTAAFVGGCDGSRSAVRELCGITFPGAPYEHVFSERLPVAQRFSPVFPDARDRSLARDRHPAAAPGRTR